VNWPAVKDRLDAYEKLMRLDKPIGILLLLWPTLWGLWLASAGRPDWLILWVFLLGTVLMRSAGCVINDYADRNFMAPWKEPGSAHSWPVGYGPGRRCCSPAYSPSPPCCWCSP